MAQNYINETGFTSKQEDAKYKLEKGLVKFKWISMTLLFMHLMFIMLSIFNVANAQTYTPRNYWTFNGSPANKDSMNNFNLDFTSYACQYAVGNSGAVGKSLSLGSTGDNINAGNFVPDSAFSIEFLFKPGYNFSSTTFFRRLDGAFSASMNLQGITFGTYTNGTGYDELVITFDAIGKAAYGYYIDNNWHHLVFKYSANTGKKEIYVDGECPSTFSKTISGKLVNGGNTSLFFNQGVSYYKYYGEYDEIATYYSSIPKALIYKHYIEYRQQGSAYGFVNNYTQTIPNPAAISGPLDMTEFAPGHPSVNVNALDQLKSYPTPRYKPGNTLLKNFNWVDLMYMGGRFQPGVSDAQSVTTSTSLNEELAKNWNYMIQLKLSMDAWGTSWSNLANQNPQLGTSIITLRAQLYPSNISSQNLANDKYFQNTSGTFLDPNGNSSSHKWWRPTTAPSVYENDGTQQRSNLQAVLNSLTRPLTMINENGEVFPWITDNALAMDPQVVAAKNASGLDYQTFQGRKFKENETQSYRDMFMSLPGLSGTRFTEYGIDGFPQYRQKYSEARLVNSQINSQYYSTPDFYPRWPNNWRNWVSAWHGWQWIVDSRYYELQSGDNLFSPFLAAGWDVNEENNIRPAQFLGLVKCLSMMGAEFFYTGYFNEAGNYSPPNPPPGNPADYAWQTAIPSYAQAISSRYEDLFRHGQVMNGDVPAYVSNTSKPGYTFWAGDLRKLVVIRKHNTLAQYAITGTIQPTTSMIGGAENESVATITLAGQQLKFKVRRQGSTYIYDNTNTTNPVFYQLDEWHEKTHPSYWSKDFTTEAELYDNTSATFNLKTTVPTGTTSGDYTNSTTSIVYPSSQTSFTPIEYNIQPRSSSQSNLFLWVRARSVDGTATGVSISVDNGTAKTIGCITDSTWTWYRFDACDQQAIQFTGLSLANHVFRFTPSNNKLMFDKFVLSSNSSLISTAPAACSSGSSASVTPSGATAFCQGNNVTLTASAGTSYLWSNGATTQAITVNQSGNYSVSVFQTGGCAAVSNPVNVAVSALPTATITAGGPTTICSGGSVALTASAGSSYLWSNGATTQSINVSTAGNYTVEVTNAQGCDATSAATAVTVTSSTTATITAGGSTTFCQGGSVVLTANTGTSYLWSNGATTKSITATTAGQYSVTVNNGSCSASSSATTVTISNNATASITASGTTTFCQGGSVSLTASAGSSYLWSNGATSQSINVTSTGQYSVTVNNGSCSATSSPTSVTVSNVATATITAAGSTTICQGASVVLTANTGTSYLWSNGATTKSIAASTAGQYSVTVSNGNCSATSAATTVTVSSAATASITASGATTFCQGGSVSLTASAGSSYIWSTGATSQSINVTGSGQYSVTVSNGICSATSAPTGVTVSNAATATITAGGATTFCQGGSVVLTANTGTSYLWSNGATTKSITAATAGQYSVTVNNGSCSATSAATIVSVSNATTASITASGATTFCQGGSVSLTASAGSSYLWSNGATSQSINVSASGQYSVTVSNGNCSATSTPTNVTVANAVTANITAGGATTFCQGGSVVLTASAGTSYVWSNGATSQSITVNNSGQYSVTVSNGSCSATSAATSVTVANAVTASITASGATTFCQGGSVTLTASSGTSYLWSNGATTQSINVNSTGQYSVTVSNGSCSAISAATSVSVANSTTASITASGATTFCQGGSVTLTASTGTAYLWSNGATTKFISVNNAGQYNVTVTNGSCSATSSPTAVTVNAIPSAIISANGPIAFCQGGSVMLTSSTGSSYLWSNGATTKSITATSGGAYTVKVTTSSCSATSSATNVSVSALPIATVTAGGATSFCQGGSVVLTASQGLYYTWSNGATTKSITATNAGSYSVIVSNGICSATSSATAVIVNTLPVATITASGSTSLTQGQSVTLTASTGTSYIWSNGATTQSITVTTAGSYFVKVKNSSGCQSTSTPLAVTVTTSTAPASITSSSVSNSICAGSSVTLTASPGTSYVWLPTLQATSSITVSAAGTYTVNVLNANGTSSSASVTITQAPVPAAPQLTYSYVPSSAYILNAFEGSAVSYSWSTGQSASSIQVNNPGTYSARAVNAYGCISPAASLKVNSLQVINCAKPDMLTAYNILNNQAVLAWNPAITADSFLVAYAVKGSTTYKRVYVKATNYLLVKELSVATIYSWSVTAICSSGQYKSDASYFTTLTGPTGCGSTVLNTQTNSVTNSSAQLSWYGTSASSVTIRYKKVGALAYSYTTISAGNNAAWGYSLTGLLPATTYQWGAKTSCGTVSSTYSSDINFTTKSACPDLGVPVIVNVKASSAEVKWIPDPQVLNVTIRYAPEGSTSYQYVYVSGSKGTALLQGLKSSTKYNVWIRSMCSLSSLSTWGTSSSFTTSYLRLGEENAGNMQLNAYPNPATDRITYAFYAEKSGDYSLKVCDMTGRELIQEKRLADEGNNSGEIMLTNYSTGMYLIVVKQAGQQSFLRFQVNK